MASKDKELHRKGFDILVDQFRQSIFLAASLVQEYNANADVDSKASAAWQLLNATLERYSDIYRRSTYQQIPLDHLLSSAIYTEALLAYECEQYADRLRKLDSNHPQLSRYLFQGDRHTERVHALIDTLLRANNLDVSANYPYVMPYRGVYIEPFTEAIQKRLVSEREYFIRWSNGIVTLLREDDIDEFRSMAERIFILFLDADELLDQNLMLESAELEVLFKNRLDYATNTSEHGIGEAFPHHLNRLLLKQNVILRCLHPRLRDEQHTAAHRYSSPLVTENTQQLQHCLMEYPSWAPQDFDENSDKLQLLTVLEKTIQSHTSNWVERGKTEDSAGLLFQFEGVLQSGDISQQLSAF